MALNGGNASVIPAPWQDLKDYMAVDRGQLEIPQLGITVRNGITALDNGEYIYGARVVDISATGPAAKAPDFQQSSPTALMETLVASARFFPPALLAVALLTNINTGNCDNL